MRWWRPPLLRLLSILALALPSTLVGQTPAVISVVNSVTGDTRLSPGVLATVAGVNLADGKPPVVMVGGRPAPFVSSLGEDSAMDLTFEIQVPVELPPGPTTLVVTTSARSSVPFDITLAAYAPSLDYITRSTVPTGASDFNDWCGLLARGSAIGATAVPGEILTVFAIGLGPTNPTVGTGATPSGLPAATAVKPQLIVGQQQAEVVESALVPGLTGIYRIVFKVPSANGLHIVKLTIGGQTSNILQLPLGRPMRNLSTPKWVDAPAAPESMVTASSCQAGLASSTERLNGSTSNPPTTLGGTSLIVRDSAGVERSAPIFYVDRFQANYLIPSGTAAGVATVTATSGDGTVSSGDVEIQSVAPGLFVPAEVVRVRSGAQTVEVISQVVEAAEGTTGGPGLVVPSIDLGPDTDVVYLALFGTGIRGRSSLANVSVRIGGVDAPVEYAGPQGQTSGMDQVNVRLPRSMAGRGAVTLELTVDGTRANRTFLTFK